MRVRPYVRYIDNSLRSRSELASGEICIAIGASGEIVQARDMAVAAGNRRRRALRRAGGRRADVG